MPNIVGYLSAIVRPVTWQRSLARATDEEMEGKATAINIQFRGGFAALVSLVSHGVIPLHQFSKHTGGKAKALIELHSRADPFIWSTPRD